MIPKYAQNYLEGELRYTNIKIERIKSISAMVDQQTQGA